MWCSVVTITSTIAISVGLSSTTTVSFLVLQILQKWMDESKEIAIPSSKVLLDDEPPIELEYCSMCFDAVTHQMMSL